MLARPSTAKPLRKGDVAGLMRRLKADFKQGYFITGGMQHWVRCMCQAPTMLATSQEADHTELCSLKSIQLPAACPAGPAETDSSDRVHQARICAASVVITLTCG